MSRNLLARTPVAKEYLNLVTTPITTAAWVQVVAALSQPASAIEIFNGSGSVIKLATGTIGNEVELPYYVLPGGSAILLPWSIAKGLRLSAKAVNANATTGQFVLNFFG